jgi:NADH dehydrogenase [ubiquinone] 1 alpha subcomplex assembly factor 5
MLPLLRWYASGIDVMDVFDRNTKRLQRNRAAIASDAHIYDYLKDEVASRMVDRVCDVARFFPAALDVGCGRGHIAKEMNSDIVGTLYQCDMAENMVSVSSECPDKEVITHRLFANEDSLPFEPNTFNLVISSLR